MSTFYQPFPLPAGLAWNRAPVAYHGLDELDRVFVYPGRLAVAGRWPAPRPEECRYEGNDGVWLGDGTVLVCPGCGLDCT
jgi:hypothetical protein